ncbi:hypothetical protein EJ08DRAFT_691380 [Tothia fuscella]|uniref:Uncharacterized protein n=1 Tax=Tothia fuscella TaxID=1048955 RepID=A0A9P4U5G4_9PEZI|nr:hypothetical protein EJ08DRAFT_691380 [Tothia fuscella]
MTNYYTAIFPAPLTTGGSLILGGEYFMEVELNQTSSIGGDVNISGPLYKYVSPFPPSPVKKTYLLFFRVSMPSLKSVGGTFDAQGVFKKDYTCENHRVVPSAITNGSSINVPSNKDNNSLSKGSIVVVVVAGVALGAAIVGFASFIFLRKIKKRREEMEEVKYDAIEANEIDGKQIPPNEMATGLERHELPEQHGLNETVEEERQELQG